MRFLVYFPMKYPCLENWVLLDIVDSHCQSYVHSMPLTNPLPITGLISVFMGLHRRTNLEMNNSCCACTESRKISILDTVLPMNMTINMRFLVSKKIGEVSSKYN